MSARDGILAAVRAHLPKVDRPDPLVPLFDSHPPADLLQTFGEALERMGGEFLQPGKGGALAPVHAKLAGAKVVCSNVPEVEGNKALGPDTRPTDLADIDYGVVRAAFAVAETGSVCLTDEVLGVNTLGYLPQHLIVLLDPADIVPNIHHAYRRPEWRRVHYAVFQTGPSATADIEGVLIHGAQGVRSLSVLPLARTPGRQAAGGRAMSDLPIPRRTILTSGVSAAASLSLRPNPATAQGSEHMDTTETRTAPVTHEVVLSVNGVDHTLVVDTRITLLDTLREKLGLSGSKKGCDQGQCGACTVLVDGERHLACLTLAVATKGFRITTVEGLAEGDRLHPMQQAFVDHDAFQCGYCTSGQIMSAIACVHEGHAGTDKDIREYMSGNLCRCAAYPNIVAAIRQAKQEMEAG